MYKDNEGTQEISKTDTVIAAKGHTLAKTEAKPESCIENGNIEYWHCSVCGKFFSDSAGTEEIEEKDTVITAKGHNWTEWKTTKEATEEEEGIETRTCLNDESHKEERTIPKLNHVHDLVKTDAKEANCTEDGNTEYWTCSKCGRLYSDAEGTTVTTAEKVTIKATGHDWNEWTVQKEATEDEEGLEVRTCKNDPSHKEERNIAKLPHTHNLIKTEAKAATCTSAGNIEYWTCSKCGKYYSDANAAKEIAKSGTVISAKGHNWSDWTVTKKATCTENGSRVGTCAVCGVKTTEVIKATGHKWNTTYTIDRSPTASSTGSVFFFPLAAYWGQSLFCTVYPVTAVAFSFMAGLYLRYTEYADSGGNQL